MNIAFEKEVLQYLNIPSIPLKEFDGKSSFDNGVAVVDLGDEMSAYAVATFDTEKDEKPRIKKTFSLEPFYGIKKIFVVPSYMETSKESIEKSDLDNESKEAAIKLAEEAHELEDAGTESEDMKEMKELPEWVFPEITNIEEAVAWLKNYQSRNKIKGRVPKDEEVVKLRLLNIWNEMKQK